MIPVRNKEKETMKQKRLPLSFLPVTVFSRGIERHPEVGNSPNQLTAALYPKPLPPPTHLQAHSGGEGVNGAASRGDREPCGQREPGGPESGPRAPPGNVPHCFGHRLLPSQLPPPQRQLHPQAHAPQSRPRHGAHGRHDAGVLGSARSRLLSDHETYSDESFRKAPQ